MLSMFILFTYFTYLLCRCLVKIIQTLLSSSTTLPCCVRTRANMMRLVMSPELWCSSNYFSPVMCYSMFLMWLHENLVVVCDTRLQKCGTCGFLQWFNLQTCCWELTDLIAIMYWFSLCEVLNVSEPIVHASCSSGFLVYDVWIAFVETFYTVRA